MAHYLPPPPLPLVDSGGSPQPNAVAHIVRVVGPAAYVANGHPVTLAATFARILAVVPARVFVTATLAPVTDYTLHGGEVGADLYAAARFRCLLAYGRTPAGTVAAPVFVGTQATPAGTLNAPAFAGINHNHLVNINNGAVSDTPIGHGGAGSAMNNRGLGAVAGLTGVQNTQATGTVAAPVFTGTPATPAGTIAAPAFTGTSAKELAEVAAGTDLDALTFEFLVWGVPA